MRVYFVLIAEGSSDRGLVRHIEALCVDAGAEEASGIAPDLGRVYGVGNSLRDKLRAAVDLEPTANLFFLHRDADSRDHKPRHGEIREAIAANNLRMQSVVDDQLLRTFGSHHRQQPLRVESEILIREPFSPSAFRLGEKVTGG